MKTLIAGGGTGGHLFPALALADALRGAEGDADILFVGTPRGMEADLVPRSGYPIEFIRASALKGVGLGARLRALAALPRAVWQSLGIVRRFRPDVVVGVGGYASGPVVLAAWLARRPIVLAEQNAIPGLTNRVLARLARVVCVTFEESRRYLPPGKVRVTGNPVRRDVGRAASEARAHSDCARVLVVGGSQGARALNEIATRALTRVARDGAPLRVVHQSGRHDEERVRRAYAEAGVEADVRPFLDDVADRYRDADLVIARAGATTLAELCVVGRPAVLVPYPYAADDHQWANARHLRDAGAALVFRQHEIDEELLADVLRGLLGDEARRTRMAQAMRGLGRPDAAARVAEECRRTAEERSA